MSTGHPSQLVVVVTLKVRPGMEDEFLRLLTPVLDAMRHEPTFISAALHRSPDDPTSFMLYEVWADLDDLVNVQIKRDYRTTYEARLPPTFFESHVERRSGTACGPTSPFPQGSRGRSHSNSLSKEGALPPGARGRSLR